MADCIFTVDVEEYYHAENILYSLPYDKLVKLPGRLEIGLCKILELLEKTGSKGTFFTLGSIAEDNKKLIKKISDSGHEIASHGYRHIPLYKHTPQTFEKDLEKSLGILSDITGQKIIGYRVTGFSFSDKFAWVFDILKKHGIVYDSSLCPSFFRKSHHKFIAEPEFNKQSNGILEFPPSFIKLGPIEVPLGGGYFRAYPYWLTKWGLTRSYYKRRTPPLFYIHPWELDPKQPRFKLPPIKSLRHYFNLNTTEKKLRRLLDEMKFMPVRDFLIENKIALI